MKLKKRLQELVEKSSPKFWTVKTYIYTALVLLGINAFGPQGGVRYILLRQEYERLSQDLVDQKKKQSQLELQIRNFRKSDSEKMRLLREELGFLKPDEISFEITHR
jgi:hypothetical protein